MGTNDTLLKLMLPAIVDLVNKEEWLLLLHVVVITDEPSELSATRRISTQVSPHTTADDIKTLVLQKWDIPWKYQRLYRENNTEPFFSTQTVLENRSARPEYIVHVRVVKLDPTQEALFDMVGLGCSRDRDDRMRKLCVGRNPGECPKGHNLPVYKSRSEAPYTPKSLWCAICSYCPRDLAYADRGDDMELILCSCKSCGDWALCNYCLKRDSGLGLQSRSYSTSSADPYHYIQELALKLANQRMKPACWFEHDGPERAEYSWSYPRVDLDHELAPHCYGLWTPPDKATIVTPKLQVIHAGATVRFRIQPELRSALLSAGQGDTVKRLERDTLTLDSVATIRDLASIREQQRKNSKPCWDMIDEAMQGLYPVRYDDPPAAFMSVKSYSLDEVVLELGACLGEW